MGAVQERRAFHTEHPLTETKTLQHPKAGGRKFLGKPLKNDVGKSKGENQSSFLLLLTAAISRGDIKPRLVASHNSIPSSFLPKHQESPRGGTEGEGMQPLGGVGDLGCPWQLLPWQLTSNETLFSAENNRAQSWAAGRPSQPQVLNKALIM